MDKIVDEKIYSNEYFNKIQEKVKEKETEYTQRLNSVTSSVFQDEPIININKEISEEKMISENLQEDSKDVLKSDLNDNDENEPNIMDQIRRDMLSSQKIKSQAIRLNTLGPSSNISGMKANFGKLNTFRAETQNNFERQTSREATISKTEHIPNKNDVKKIIKSCFKFSQNTKKMRKTINSKKRKFKKMIEGLKCQTAKAKPKREHLKDLQLLEQKKKFDMESQMLEGNSFTDSFTSDYDDN